MNYFESELNMQRIFGFPRGLTMPNASNAQAWLDKIENDLSPENLTCDGELRGAQLRTKQRNLLAAQQHCLNLLGRKAPVDPFAIAYGVAVRANRRERTQQRMEKLNQSIVKEGKTVGAHVLLKNGVRGTIVQINRTRFRVQGNDGRTWMVPPSCCIVLEQGK